MKKLLETMISAGLGVWAAGEGVYGGLNDSEFPAKFTLFLE
jgi:hypothetical protein